MGQEHCSSGMGGDSCSEGHGLESQHHLLDGHFLHLSVLREVEKMGYKKIFTRTRIG